MPGRSMRKDAEILMRSSIIDIGTYLDVINVDPNVQVEIIKALAYASRIADFIAAREHSDNLQPTEVATVRQVAARFNDAVASLSRDPLQSWLRGVADRVIEFCNRCESALLYQRPGERSQDAELRRC